LRCLASNVNPIVIQGRLPFKLPHTQNGALVNRFECFVLQKNGNPSGLVKVQFVNVYDGTPTTCQPVSETTAFTDFSSLSDWKQQNWVASEVDTHSAQKYLYTISRRQFIEFGKHKLSGRLNMCLHTTSRPSKQVEWLHGFDIFCLHWCSSI